MSGMGLQMPFGDCWREDGLKDAIYRSVDRIRDSLARACIPEKRKIITWPVTGVDLKTPYVDVPWLDTGIESGTLQTCPGKIQEWSPENIVVNRYTLARYRNRIFELFRCALARYRYRVWNIVRLVNCLY